MKKWNGEEKKKEEKTDRRIRINNNVDGRRKQMGVGLGMKS